MWSKRTQQSLNLSLNEIHLWHVHIPEHIERLVMYEALLDEQEKHKADRFRFEKDRNCSIIARGVLRKLLGSYLEKEPEGVRFVYGDFGKPEVSNDEGIAFNISHARDAIVLGFVKNNWIGVDVEFLDQKIDPLNIAKHFFSDEEKRALEEVSKENRVEGFYNCWTRKEAFIKAVGDGLSFPLDQFVVSLKPKVKAALLCTKWDKNEKNKWTLQSSNPEQEYVSAFAVKGKVSETKFWRYI